jgi:hypothetical protein
MLLILTPVAHRYNERANLMNEMPTDGK